MSNIDLIDHAVAYLTKLGYTVPEDDKKDADTDETDCEYDSDTNTNDYTYEVSVYCQKDGKVYCATVELYAYANLEYDRYSGETYENDWEITDIGDVSFEYTCEVSELTDE